MAEIKNSEKTQGYFSVFAAIIGNSFLTVIKFTAWFFSGSSALFSESVHSFADTLNQSLLMIGIRKSKKKADEEFSYGYGQERFLWALISAVGIFFLGSGVTVYHGINSLAHKESIHINQFTIIVLLVSLIIETITFSTAARELWKNRNGDKLKEIFENGDPATIAVIYEDGVAVIGILIAISSIILSSLTKEIFWDSFGSILIGVMLGIMAILLIKKNGSFLIKKAIPEDMKEKIIEILEADPVIEKVIDFKSSILDIGSYHIKCEIEFNGPALMKERKFLKEDYESVKDNFEEFKKLIMEYADRIPRVIGKRIDDIEKKIQKEIPGIEHIDIEIN